MLNCVDDEMVAPALALAIALSPWDLYERPGVRYDRVCTYGQ